MEYFIYVNSCNSLKQPSDVGIKFPSVQYYLEAVNAFIAQGYQVQITELDMIIENPSSSSEKIQRERYRTIFTELLKIKKNGGIFLQ